MQREHFEEFWKQLRHATNASSKAKKEPRHRREEPGIKYKLRMEEKNHLKCRFTPKLQSNFLCYKPRLKTLHKSLFIIPWTEATEEQLHTVTVSQIHSKSQFAKIKLNNLQDTHEKAPTTLCPDKRKQVVPPRVAEQQPNSRGDLVIFYLLQPLLASDVRQNLISGP